VPATTSRQDLEAQTNRLLDTLHRELQPPTTADQITALGQHHFQRLLANATITEFIPLLVYRATKQDLFNAVQAQPCEPTKYNSAAQQSMPAAA
jgi:hypothetical protein